MSAPRIFVRRDSNINHWSWHLWEWTCTACFPCHGFTFGYEHQAHAAADAGRAHLAAHHTAHMPHPAHRDTDTVNAPHKPAQPFGDDSPCCANPVRHAHTHSREGA